MESLENLLGRYSPQEPTEVLAIKRYIDEQFHLPVSVAVQQNAITITVSSAALANTLRLQAPKIQAAAQTDKRLLFRIG